jgi:hypothetical protein
MRRAASILAVGLTIGCAQGSPPDLEKQPPSDDSGMGPVPEGYTRFVTTPRKLAPGEEVMLNEWVTAPEEADVDIVDVKGEVATTLHHFVLYSVTTAEEVGTVRPWQETDQLTLGLRMAGAFGKEALGSYHFPPDVVLRVSAGRSLMANVHYINASTEPVTGHAWIDVKLAKPSPNAKVAGMVTSLDTTLSLPPHAQSSYDVTCVVAEDIGLIAWANHMHELGSAVDTELVRADGTKVDVRRDPTWSPEWVFDPPFSTWPVESPLLLRAGDTLHTRCTWNNTEAGAVAFPREMCLGFGFFIGPKDLTCLAGKWL